MASKGLRVVSEGSSMESMGEHVRRDPGQRLTVAQAAAQLGISVDAMRARVKRGTVATEREEGRVYILLDADQDADQDAPRANEFSALISQLREEIAYLRDENRRKDHIIAGLVERIPALEAPRENAPESPVSPGPSATPTEPPEGPHAAPERPQERSWWRRVFGQRS
jgi:hypothetical protein